MGLTVWDAPSFDEPFGKNFFKPVSRQILLFVLGFIFPFGKSDFLLKFILNFELMFSLL
jgi:hypothetical protein